MTPRGTRDPADGAIQVFRVTSPILKALPDANRNLKGAPRAGVIPPVSPCASDPNGTHGNSDEFSCSGGSDHRPDRPLRPAPLAPLVPDRLCLGLPDLPVKSSGARGAFTSVSPRVPYPHRASQPLRKGLEYREDQ